MIFLLTILGAEILVLSHDPLVALLDDVLNSPDEVERNAASVTGYLLMLNACAIWINAFYAVRSGRLLEQVCYMFGLGLILEHLVRRLDFYSGLYSEMNGSIQADALIVMCYALLPPAVMLAPVLLSLSTQHVAIWIDRYGRRR